MSIERFLEPRLTGPRFEGHAIPLEFLKDLAVLEEMIIEVAKAEFLKSNTDRKRSPRGFTDGVAFKLTGVEEGSARPVISLVIASTSLFAPASQGYFEKARDAIVNAISAAEQNQPVKDFLPAETLSYFDRIGRSLRDGEAMEFSRGGQNPPAKLTRETRRRLLLASPDVTEVTEETTIRGKVPEADQKDLTFELELFDRRIVKAPIAPQHRDTILKAFAQYKSGARVLLHGVGRFNRHERLIGLHSIEHVSILDPLDVLARLDELRLIQNGWLEGGGMAPPAAFLDWLTEAFTANYPEDLQLPYLYPTGEGGVQAEWSIAKEEITLEIDAVSHRGQWHQLNMATDAELEREIDLNDPEAWKWVVGQLEPLIGGAA